jgi:hypothetical protein
MLLRSEIQDAYWNILTLMEKRPDQKKSQPADAEQNNSTIVTEQSMQSMDETDSIADSNAFDDEVRIISSLLHSAQ